MKNIIFLLLFLSQLEAVVLTYPDGKKEFFVEKKDTKSRALTERRYYKNGIVSKRTLFKDTRKIYVSFKNSVDIEEFKNRYNLMMLKETNKMFHTYLFEIKDSTDVVELCSTINKREDVRYAKPNWKSPRFTY